MIFKLISFTLALVVLLNAGFFGIAYAQASEFNDDPSRWSATSRLATNGLGETQLAITTGVQNVQRGGGWVKGDVSATVVAPLPFNTEWTTLQGLLRVSNNGQFCLFPNPDDESRFACFSSPVPGGLNTSPDKTDSLWTWHETDFDVFMIIDISGVAFDYLLFNDNAPTSLDVTVTLGGGGTKFLGNTIVAPPGNTVIMRLPQGEASDSSGTETEDDVSVPVDFERNGSVLTFSIDDTGLVYPIYIDPSIDLDITTGSDDYRVQHSGSFSSTDESPECGASSAGGTRENGWFFNGATTIDSGDDVTAADVNWSTRSSEIGTMISAIYMNDVESPVVATTTEEHTALDLTETALDFTSYGFSSDGAHMDADIDITTLVEEIVETDGNSPEDWYVLCLDNGSSQADNNYGRFRSTERAGATDPHISITFTEGGAPSVTFWFFYLSLVAQAAARWET